MVRLINIIKQNLRKGQPAPELDLSSGPLPPEQASVSAQNPYRRKAASLGEGEAPPVSRGSLKSIYHAVYDAARHALDQGLDRVAVETSVGRVVAAFETDPYNDLLLLAYSFSRKNYLPAHMTNDVILTVGFARSLGFEHDDLMTLGICGFCHDLGMSGFDTIYRKAQQLTPQEIEDIKQHPLRSAEIARPLFSEKVAAVITDVHERENGQGYPRGLAGADVHFWAKIIAVVDAFEALTHPRIFRSGYSPYEAIKMIIKKKDILFEDVLVKRFIDFMSIYPVGSLVSLNSGEVAMVIGANMGSPTRPVVRVVITEKREIEENPVPIDLTRREFVYITGAVEPEKEKELLYFLKPRGSVDLDEE